MKDEFYITLLEKYLKTHNIDRKELAKRLNVSAANISNWLNGVHGMTLKNKKAIEFVCAEFIGIDNNGNIVGSNAGIIGNGGTVIGKANKINMGASGCAQAIDEYRRKLQDAVMVCDNLTAEAKIVVYDLINKTK
ncbi:MAG: helix-turn-helix transcriptional regulator [Ruthenibacterium sp.]